MEKLGVAILSSEHRVDHLWELWKSWKLRCQLSAGNKSGIESMSSKAERILKKLLLLLEQTLIQAAEQ